MRTRKLNGVEIELTPAQVTEREAEELANSVRSTDPNKYTHTRRSFKMLLTDAMEAEIKSKIQAIPSAGIKREVRAFFEDEPIFRWDDPTMIKLRNNLESTTVVALEAAWVA